MPHDANTRWVPSRPSCTAAPSRGCHSFGKVWAVPADPIRYSPDQRSPPVTVSREPMRQASSAYSVGTRLCTLPGTRPESCTQLVVSLRQTLLKNDTSLKRLSSYSAPATRVWAPSSSVPRSPADIRASRGDSLAPTPPERVLVVKSKYCGSLSPRAVSAPCCAKLVARAIETSTSPRVPSWWVNRTDPDVCPARVKRR